MALFPQWSITDLAVLVSMPTSLVPTSAAIALTIICVATIAWALRAPRRY